MTPAAGPETLVSFGTCPSLSSLAALSSLYLSAAASDRRRASGRWSEPWRRRRPPRRRACSPTGEHAAVERPGRGAPLTEPGEQLPPLGTSSSAPTKGCPGSSFPMPARVDPSPSLSPFPPPSFRFGSRFPLIRTEPKEGIRVRVSLIPFFSFL